ncbi:Evolved beta-galactosidase subunit beta [compost metagenome]
MEWAAKRELCVEQPYDDTTDREWLAGEVRERQKVGNGQVVIFENDEAYRFAGDAPVRKLIIKVTVEGGYFKNK